MKSIILTLLISISSLTLLIAQNTTASESGNQISLGAAVNIAGKQRMLTQRMAKDFVYIGMNIHTELATRERASSIILFEENFKVLSGFAPSEKIKAHLIKEEVLWKEYKNSLSPKPPKTMRL
jgi:nitrate/nitrite-specific signal transduction histidine kinase